MNSLIDNKKFRENLLRLYLGKYESRFYQERPELGLELKTKSTPKLVVTLILSSTGVWIALYEYIDIDEDDSYNDYYEYYSREITRVPAEDPDGIKKIEEAVTKAFIAGPT